MSFLDSKVKTERTTGSRIFFFNNSSMSNKTDKSVFLEFRWNKVFSDSQQFSKFSFVWTGNIFEWKHEARICLLNPTLLNSFILSINFDWHETRAIFKSNQKDLHKASWSAKLQRYSYQQQFVVNFKDGPSFEPKTYL